MCHTLLISKCEIAYEISEDTLEILARCTVKVEGKTGVEMEALTGVSVTLLTIYVDFRQDEFHGAENRYTGHIVLLNTEFCNKGRNCKCFCKMEYVRIVLNFDSQNRVAFDHTHFER